MGGNSARLRTKTGCFRCRQSRVKCDEQRPICQRCTTSRVSCLWPSLKDSIDRRHRKTLRQDRTKSLADQSALQCDRTLLYDHFAEVFLPQLIRSDSGDVPDVMAYLLSLASHSGITLDAMLACSAMDIARSHPSSRLRDTTLEYYIRSVEGLQDLLATNKFSAGDDALLATVSYLLIFENARIDALPKFGAHINAMAKLLSLRHVSGTLSTKSSVAFNRLMAESFIYHGSLLMLFDHDFDPFKDPRLLTSLQRHLESDVEHPVDHCHNTICGSSPILLAPCNFFILIADATRYSKAHSGVIPIDNWDGLDQRLRAFESAKSFDHNVSSPSKLHLSAVRALISIIPPQPDQQKDLLSHIMRQASAALSSTKLEQSFTSYYLWPLAVIGAMAVRTEEIELVRCAISDVPRAKQHMLMLWIGHRLEDIWKCTTTEEGPEEELRRMGLCLLISTNSLNSMPLPI